MAKATLSSAQVATMLSLRGFPTDAGNTVRASLFASFKDGFGIPEDHKLTVDLDGVGGPLFGMLIRKKTGLAYGLGADGKWDQTTPSAVDGGPTTAVGTFPQPVRWFTLTADHLVAAITGDHLDSCDWDSGMDTKPDGDDVFTSDSGIKLIRDSDDFLHIGLIEDDFNQF